MALYIGTNLIAGGGGSLPDNVVIGEGISKIVSITKSEYEALTDPKDSSILYVISDGDIDAVQSTPDWGQNDPDGLGYIKGRTHWSEEKKLEVTYDGSYPEGADTVYSEGMYYAKVTDEVPPFENIVSGKFTATLSSNSSILNGSVCTGNFYDMYELCEGSQVYYVGSGGASFIVISDPDKFSEETGHTCNSSGVYFQVADDYMTYIKSATFTLADTVHQLDEKYIPDSVKSSGTEIKYTSQSLTHIQRLQARTNIGAVGVAELPASVLYTAQTLTEDQKAQARENIGILIDPDCHAEYFTITDNGVVSLKPEYRGATTFVVSGYEASISDKGALKEGSKNRSLPETLYIPNTVDGTAVVGIASRAFIDNYALKKVVLPSTVDSLPDMCFFNCYFLEEICNTENITSIGVRCLNYCSSLKMVKFPNLVEAFAASMGSFAFAGNPNLTYADIGNMDSIPGRMFMYDHNLQKVRNRGIVTSVGDAAFFKAVRLRDVGDLSQLTTIGGAAFVGPDIKYVDWSNYTGSDVAAWSTPAKINPVDFWSECTYTACENPLPTFMSNRNPAWATKNIGSSSALYSAGCQLFTVLHAYCGLHNLKLNNPFEFEDIVNQRTPGALDSFSTLGSAGLELVANAVGINLKKYTAFNQTTLQAVYDALADGKYVAVTVGDSAGDAEGHWVLVYGIKNNGELMFVDSDSIYYNDQTIPQVYSAFYENYLVHNPNYGVFILS